MSATTTTARPPLRLTLRGRLLVLALACLVPFLALTAGRALAASPQQPETRVVVTVAPGETLWTIAGNLAPEGDRRETMAQLVKLNNLDSQVLQAGQELTVPSRP